MEVDVRDAITNLVSKSLSQIFTQNSKGQVVYSHQQECRTNSLLLITPEFPLSSRTLAASAG